MVFKRRDRLPFVDRATHWFWPRTGWARAVRYLRHRLHRLPDTPESISRGIFAGVFVTFTPLFGLHFILAALLARMMRGNLIAALFGTLVGNPLTFLPIAAISLKVGHFMLGTRFDPAHQRSIVGKFADAGGDLWANFLALFTEKDANWNALSRFGHEIFYPYMVGGILPGIVAGLAAYYLSLPMIRAYQKRRRGRLASRIEALRRRSAAKRRGD